MWAPRQRRPNKAPRCPVLIQQSKTGPTRWKKDTKWEEVLLWKTRSLPQPHTGVFPALGKEETQAPLGSPACNNSSDLDCCLPSCLLPWPPLGLANRDGDVGASLGLGDSLERMRREGSGPGERHWRGGLSAGSSVWSVAHPRQTLNPTLDLADGGKNRIKFVLFFKKWMHGSQARLLLLVIFLFKQTAWLLRSSKSH